MKPQDNRRIQIPLTCIFLFLSLVSSISGFLTYHEFKDNAFYSKEWKTYIYNGSLQNNNSFYNFHYR